MPSKALVILSGGQDSTTVLFMAREQYDEVHTITFNYGQRHSLEIEAAAKIAQLAKVRSHRIVDIPGILYSTSPLVSPSALEKYESYEQMDKVIGDRVELTFVPMRNVLFFVVAANRAIALGIRKLITGICQADNANYPDTTETFRAAMEATINTALGIQDFHLLAPLMNYPKRVTAETAYAIPGCAAALAFSHTSYDGKYPPTDNNHANVLRAQGFLEAGLPDPLVVRAVRDSEMPLPKTSNYAPWGDATYKILLEEIRSAEDWINP